MIKKLSIFCLTVIMAVWLAGCGKDSIVATNIQSSRNEQNEEKETTNINVADNDDTVKINVGGKKEATIINVTSKDNLLPSMSGSLHGIEFSLVGVDYTESDSDFEPAVRLWFSAKNNSSFLQAPECILNWDSVTVTQNDTKLKRINSKEDHIEQRIADKALYPGTEVIFSCSYKMLDEENIISIDIAADDGNMTFDFKPDAFLPIIPEKKEWVITEEYSTIEFQGNEYENYAGVSYSISDIQIFDETDEAGANTAKLIKIVYDVKNNSKSDNTAYGVFTPMQKGVELEQVIPQDIDEKVDIINSVELKAKEKRKIAITYKLYDDENHIVFYLDDTDAILGAIYNIK